jgi:hypothetical protein
LLITTNQTPVKPIQVGGRTAESLELEALSEPDMQAVIQITRVLEQTVNQA